MINSIYSSVFHLPCFIKTQFDKIKVSSQKHSTLIKTLKIGMIFFSACLFARSAPFLSRFKICVMVLGSFFLGVINRIYFQKVRPDQGYSVQIQKSSSSSPSLLPLLSPNRLQEEQILIQMPLLKEDPLSQTPIPSSSIDDSKKPHFLEIFREKSQPSLTKAIDSPLVNPVDESKQILLLDEGQLISYEFKDQETLYGKEEVERIDTLSQFKVILENRLAYLNQNLANNISVEDSQLDLNLTKKLLMNLEELLKNTGEKTYFIRSNFYRKQLRKIVEESRNYKEKVDGICLGALVNYRYHSCLVADKKVGLFRFGIMTDLRNGFTHLGELKTLIENKKLLSNKRNEISEKLKTYDEKDPAKYAACAYALNQLDPNHIKLALHERRSILTHQMLQLIQNQADKNLSLIKNSSQLSSFDLVHLSLLNPKNQKIDATGWVHHEENQMKDMHEIFNEFSDKKLIFDGQGPFIDLEGNLHMKQLIHQNKEIKTLILNTYFINISVQGHEKNDGEQKKINDHHIKKLLSLSEKKIKNFPANQDFRKARLLLKQIKNDLKQGKSNYQIAEDIGIALLQLNMMLSVSCLSAKDRTGFVCGRIMLNFVSEGMEENEFLQKNIEKKEELKKQFAYAILDEKSCAAQVVKDNTGHTILKCTPLSLPGFEDSQGKRFRLKYGAKQVAMTITSKN